MFEKTLNKLIVERVLIENDDVSIEKVFQLLKSPHSHDLGIQMLSIFEQQEIDNFAKSLFKNNFLATLDNWYPPMVIGGANLIVFLEKLSKIESFELYNIRDYSTINHLTSDIIEGLKLMPKLRELNLSNLGLVELNEDISQLSNIKTLFLKNNMLRQLPDTISRIYGLENLNVYDNMLSTVPKSLTGLEKLYRLSIGNNQFQNIPEEILNMKNIQILDIGSNSMSFENIVNDLPRLSNLTELDISDIYLSRKQWAQIEAILPNTRIINE